MKEDKEILDKLLEETSNGKIHWTLNNNGDYFYCTKVIKTNIKVVDRFEVLKTDVSILFLASDYYSEDEFGGVLEYYGYIDMFLRKNEKKAVFLKRFKEDQQSIQSILSEISKKYKLEK